MAWKKSIAYRSDPGVSANQKIRVNSLTDPVDGNTTVQETVLISGAPSWLLNIGRAEAPTIREYPFAGGTPTSLTTPSVAATFGTPSSANATFVRLDSKAMNGGTAAFQDANAINPTGLALCILSGNAKGQVTRITGWHAGSPTSTVKEVDITPSLVSNIFITDSYCLGFLCEYDTELLIKSEFSAAPASAPSAQIAVIFTDLGQNEDGTRRAPIRYFDRIYDIPNLGYSLDGLNGYHGQTVQLPCKGGVVASVLLVTKPAAGTIDLWISSI